MCGGGPGGFVVKHAYFVQFGKGLQHRCGQAQKGCFIGVAGNYKQGQARGGGHAHFAAQIAAGVHQQFELAHVGHGRLVNAIGLAHGVVGNRHGFASTARHRRHFLPQLFGNEGNHRVRQAHDGFQCADQRAAGGAFLRVAARLDLHLGNFKVPVAKLVPDKVINAAGHVVQAVVFKAACDVGLHLLQQRADPAVAGAEVQVTLGGATGFALCFGVLAQTTVLSFAVHQHKAGGVPELVAEVAIALAALGIKVDAAAQRGQRGKGEAQRIRAKGWNTGGKLFLGVLAYLGRGLRLAQAFRAFGQ